jgi:hypothetical protein
MIDMGTIAFDPFLSRVWIPRTADAAAGASPPIRFKRKKKKKAYSAPAGQ